MSLRERAMLAELEVHCTAMVRTNKKAGSELKRNKKATDDSTMVSNVLVPRTATNPVISAIGDLQKYFKSQTLPWAGARVRLLATPQYIEVQKVVNEKLETIKERKAILREEYIKNLDVFKSRLGDMIDDHNYPTPSELLDSYSAKFSVSQIPDAEDLRIDVSESVKKTLKKEMNSALKAKEEEMKKDVYKRVFERVSKISEALNRIATKKKNQKVVFSKSLIDNALGLAEMLDDFNVTDDPKIKKLKKDLEGFKEVDPKEVKTSPKKRKDAEKKAKAIMDKMDGFMLM